MILPSGPTAAEAKDSMEFAPGIGPSTSTSVIRKAQSWRVANDLFWNEKGPLETSGPNPETAERISSARSIR